MMYSATSTDGINFKEDPGVRFSYESITVVGISDPDVVQLNDGSWLMFVSLGSNLLKATSPVSSGTFTRDPGFSWNFGGVSGSFNFGDSIRTFFCNQFGICFSTYDQKTGILNNMGIATAINAPATGMIGDPSIIQTGNKYLMFYKWKATANASPTQDQIYISTSTDGISWTQHADNRFICKGSVPGAVYYKGVIYVYCCWLNSSPLLELGVIISRDNGANFTSATTTIQGRTAPEATDPQGVVVGA